MTGLKAAPNQQSRRPDYLANPFLTDAQRAEVELQSVLKQGAGAKPNSPTDLKRKRTCKGQMLLALAIVLSCGGLIVNFFIQHFTNATLPQTTTPNLMNSALVARQPVSLGYQTPIGHLPPAGFHAQGSLSAYGLQPQAIARHQGKRAAHAARGPLYLSQIHGKWVVTAR